jgi:hypothetical protein
MTYDELAAEIAKMSPEERQRPAVVALPDSGEVVEITHISPIVVFNDVDLPLQQVLVYDECYEPKVF